MKRRHHQDKLHNTKRIWKETTPINREQIITNKNISKTYPTHQTTNTLYDYIVKKLEKPSFSQ